jgi:hypothetical protein
MAEEEFAADEIWFGNQFRLNESQELEFVDEDTQDDGIPEENVGLAMAMAPEVIPETQQEISTEIPMTAAQVSTEALAQPELTEATKPKAKRNTSSFAKRFLLAERDLYLDPTYSDQFSDGTIRIVGQVKECPRESNGKMYRIEWKNPLPNGLQRKWLRSFITGSKENRASLLSAMEQYDNSEVGKKKSAT